MYLCTDIHAQEMGRVPQVVLQFVVKCSIGALDIHDSFEHWSSRETFSLIPRSFFQWIRPLSTSIGGLSGEEYDVFNTRPIPPWFWCLPNEVTPCVLRDSDEFSSQRMVVGDVTPADEVWGSQRIPTSQTKSCV